MFNWLSVGVFLPLEVLTGVEINQTKFHLNICMVSLKRDTNKYHRKIRVYKETIEIKISNYSQSITTKEFLSRNWYFGYNNKHLLALILSPRTTVIGN